MALTADDYNAKVLEMKFNNDAFEKNIQQSMNSLDKFQATIDNLHGGKAFDQISEAASRINLDKIESAVMAIQNRFSELGIVGATVVYQLTNSLINFGKHLWSISLGQMSSGGWARALNIQQAEFMLKGLGLDVETIRDNALAAVKGTAYGFDEAAKAAASFGASGVSAGEDMEKALMGVAGVAAMTGSSFADIADVFTTVASQGRLMTNELTRLSYRGLNVSAVLAEQLHVSEAQVHEMVHKGKIDFKQFSEAMTDAFGKHAKDANKTFTGSISNIKAALSRIGADFASPIANDTIPALNSLIDVIDSIHDSMSPVIDMFKTWSGILTTVFDNALTRLKDSKAFSNIFNGIRNIFMSLVIVLYSVKQAFDETFPKIGGLSQAFRLLTAYLIPTEENFNGLVNIFKVFFSVVKVVFDGLKVGAKILLFLGSLAFKFLNVVLGLAAAIGELIDPYLKWIKENNVIENILYLIIRAIYEFITGSELLRKAFVTLTSYWGTLKDFLSNLGMALFNIGEFLIKFVSSIDLSQFALAAFIVTLAFTGEAVYMFGKRLIVTFGGFLFTIYNLFKQLGNILLDLHHIFNQLWQTLKLGSYEVLSNIILKSAVSILVLAAAMKVIADIPQEDLIRSGIAIALLAGALIGMVAAFTALYGADNLFKAFGVGVFTAFILSLTSGLMIMSLALKLISTIDNKDIVKAVTTVYLMGLLMIALNKLTTIQTGPFTFIHDFSLQLLSFAVTLGIMAVSLKLLSSIKERMWTAVSALAGLSAIMVVLAKFAAVTKDGVTTLKPSLFSQLALSMLTLSIAIRILADIKDPQSLDDALLALAKLSAGILIISYIQSTQGFGTIETSGFIKMAATLSIMTVCLAALSACATFPDNALGKGILALFALETAILFMMGISTIYTKVETTGFIKLAATLLLMTTCLSALATLTALYGKETIMDAIACLAGLELVVLAVAAIQQYFSLGGIKSDGFIKFAASIVLLTTALTVLSFLDPDKVYDAVFAIAGLSAIVIGVMYLSKSFDGIKSKGFATFGLAVLLLSGAVAMLAKNVSDPATLLLSVVAVGALAAITYQFVKMSQGMKNIHTYGFITFASAILILSGAVALLSLLPDSSKMVDAAVAIAGLVIAMSVAAQLAKDFDIIKGAGLAIMAVGILVLAGAIAALAGLPWDKMLVAMGVLMLLGVTLGAINTVAKGIDPASASGLIILSAAMLVMATSLLILANVPWQMLILGTVTIGALTMILVIAGNMSTAAAPGLLSLAAALVSLGVAVLGIGFGIKLAADGFMTFTNALHNLATLSKEDVAQILSNVNDLCDGIVGLAPKLALAAGALGMALGAALGVISVSLSSFAVLGIILFAYMLVESAPILLDAFGKLMDATGVWFDEHEDQVYEFGEHVGKVFMDGVLGGLTGISEAIYDKTFGAETQEYMEQMAEVEKGAMSKGAENMIEWMDMYNAGEASADNMIAGLKVGLENGFMTQEEVSRELAARGLESFNDELGIHSPSTAFAASGEYSVAGYIQGLANGEKPLNNSMTLLAKGGVESFNNEMGIHSNSDVMIESGEYTVGGLIEGVLNGEIPLEDAMAQLGDSATAAFSSHFTVGSLLGEFNSAGKDWSAEGMTWVAGDYAYKRAGFDTLDEYVAEMTEREKSRKYNDILEALGLNGDDPLKSMSDGLEDATKGLGDYSGAAGKATKVTDKLKDAIKSSLDVFSEFNDQVGTTGRNVLFNFMNQIKGVSKWSEELTALSNRGLNANFLVDLADKGPEAYDKIHALYTMTDTELSLFNQMYAKKLSLQKSTVKDIRDSFVKNGAMTEKEAAEYGKKISDAAASGVEAGSDSLTDSMTKSEKKAVKDAAEEARRQKIDDEFIQKYTVEAQYTNDTVAIFDRLRELQKGGNVNLLMRPTIDTEELNKLGWDAGEGFATMFTSTFSNDEEQFALNFTPIIVDPKTGKYLGVMEPDAFDQYCRDVVSGVRKDDLNLQVGAEFTGKNAMEQASAAAQEIHELHEQLGADWGKDNFESIKIFGENLDDTVKSDFIDKFANAVISNTSKLTMTQAFSDLGLASMNAFKQSMNFEVIMDQLIVFKNSLKEQVRSALDLFDEVTYKTNQTKKEEEISTKQMLYNMTENTKKIGRWATNIKTLTERGLSEGLVDELRQLGPEGADKIDAFVRMSDKELKKANAVYESSLKLDEYTSDKIVSAYSDAGFATAMGLKKGLKDGKDDLLFAYQETGEDASEGFMRGIDPDAAREAMKYLGKNSLEELKTALDSHSPSRETKKIGLDTTEGYIIGIESPSRLADAMSKLATTTLGLFTQLMGPDKFRIMGLECIDAFAMGILEGLETKTRDILNMFTLGMFGMNENLEDPDNSLRVNIIPVVDQSALDGTSSLMNEYFGNKRFDISASVNRANAANKTNNPDSDKNLIVEAIRGLREDIRNIKNVNEGYRTDIGSLKDAITSMKVTLDTGALVGQITNPLDAALGTKAMRSLRRRG